MRKKSITLKDGIDSTLMCRQVVDAFTLEYNISAVGLDEAGNGTKSCGFTAS